MKTDQKRKEPTYNRLQNIVFMLSLAWKEKELKVPILCSLSACLAVLKNLVNLYISPAILSIIERYGAI
jgi:hypothetical protein